MLIENFYKDKMTVNKRPRPMSAKPPLVRSQTQMVIGSARNLVGVYGVPNAADGQQKFISLNPDESNKKR